MPLARRLQKLGSYTTSPTTSEVDPMNLRRTAQALLTALAIFGVSAPAYADGSTRITSRMLQLSRLTLHKRLLTTPAKNSTPVRKATSRRPTPAEAGRAPNFRPSAR